MYKVNIDIFGKYKSAYKKVNLSRYEHRETYKNLPTLLIITLNNCIVC